jgi:hypothetical protein
MAIEKVMNASLCFEPKNFALLLYFILLKIYLDNDFSSVNARFISFELGLTVNLVFTGLERNIQYRSNKPTKLKNH